MDIKGFAMEHGRVTARKKPIKSIALNDVFAGLELTPEIRQQMTAVVGQLAKVKELTPADVRQCRELVELETRTNETKLMAAMAREGGDLSSWAKALKMLDGFAMLRRGLMRDMKLTRQTALATPASDRKQDQKAASDWEGIL
jgi:hypothetical protein